jgi:KDO2-lipid IV(A) lauroyltransferase
MASMRGKFRRTKRLLFYAAVRFLGTLAGLLPRRTALSVFAAIGNVVRRVDRPAVRRSRAHVGKALGREIPAAGRERIVREMFPAFGRNLVDLLRDRPFGSDEMQAEGLEHLERAYRRGRGVVALSGHLGNWEVLGAAVAARGYPLHVLAARLFDRRSDRLLNEWRTEHGIRVHRRSEGLGPLLAALRKGEIVGALADQDAPGRAMFVDFFRHPARTPVAPFVLGLRAGAALVPLFIHLDGEGRHRITVRPEIVPAGHLRGPARLRDLVRRWHDVLEAEIRAHPEQWVWFHRRWKSAPGPLADFGELSKEPAYLSSLQGSRRRVFAR